MKQRRTRFGLLILLMFALSAASAFGKDQSRLALVIGNANYSFAPLRNPANDANAMAAKLESLHFKVIKVVNGTLRQMVTAENEFANELSRYDVGLFYFSGHGVQYQGTNYLVPVDANIRRSIDIQFEALNADRVLADMGSAGAGVNLVILDACRNNPFGSQFRSMQRGLSVVQAPSGSLVVYSTAPDQVASDGTGSDSPFTQALLENISTPGQDVQLMFTNVFRQVQEETQGKQVPWSSSSLTSAFYFAPTPAKQVPAEVASTPAVPVPPTIPPSNASSAQSMAPQTPSNANGEQGTHEAPPSAAKPSGTRQGDSGAKIASVPGQGPSITNTEKGKLTINMTTHGFFMGSGVNVILIGPIGSDASTTLHQHLALGQSQLTLELNQGTYDVKMGYDDDPELSYNQPAVSITPGSDRILNVSLDYSPKYKTDQKIAELQSNRNNFADRLHTLQAQRAARGGWGGVFTAAGILSGIGAGLFAIAANTAYSSYLSATDSTNATYYRQSVEGDRTGFLVTAIGGGLALLIGVITLSSMPSTDQTNEAIIQLDSQLGALRLGKDLGQQ